MALTEMVIPAVAHSGVIVRCQSPRSTERMPGVPPEMKRKALPDGDPRLEPLLLDATLLPGLPRPRRVLLLFRELKVRLVARHAPLELLTFPYDDLDELGDVLVDHERVHVAVSVEEGVVERLEGFDRRLCPEDVQLETWKNSDTHQISSPLIMPSRAKPAWYSVYE